MAFFKKKKLSDGKWHAVAVNLQKPATIDDVADILAQRSTVSPGDVYAVLVQLGGVLGELMAAEPLMVCVMRKIILILSSLMFFAFSDSSRISSSSSNSPLVS